MKKLFLIGTVAFAASAFAAVSTSTDKGGAVVSGGGEVMTSNESEIPSENVYGVVKIVSSSVQTMVGVPWAACGLGAEAPVNVADLVYTNNLENGTYLHFLNDGGQTFSSWKIENGAWKEIKSVSAGGISAPEKNLGRGMAFELNRAGNATALAKPIYISGQLAATGKTVELVSTGATVPSPVMNLIASPFPDDVSLDGLTVSGANSTDSIRLPVTTGTLVTWTELKYDAVGSGGTHWYTEKPGRGGITKVWAKGMTIPSGVAFWYLCRTDGVRSIMWNR